MKLLKSSSRITFWGFIVSASFVVALFFLTTVLLPRSEKKVLGESTLLTCKTISQGNLKNIYGKLVASGFDSLGYNYEKMLFNGKYCNAFQDEAWCQPLRDINLSINWNQTFLSDKDCNSDGILDQHFPESNYVGTDAWVTNQMWGSYVGSDKQTHNWTYFIKIISAPADADLMGGFWYDSEGNELGEQIWDQFIISDENYSDPYGGFGMKAGLSPVAPGFNQGI